jgi:YVTN family beta-propeller protein
LSSRLAAGALRPALLLLSATITAFHAVPEPPQRSTLLVLSKGDHVLSIVDPATRRILGRIPSGPDPHEVVASADGRVAYISNYGGGALHTITPVDLVRQRALPVIELGALRGPHGLVFASGKLWFTAEGAKAIGRYDPATRQVDWILGTGQDRTHMLVVSSDGKRIVTTNVSSASVTVIEERSGQARRGGPGGPPPSGAASGAPGAPSGGRGGAPPGGPGGAPRVDWTETVVPVGNGAEGFDVSPDGKEAWVANADDGTISVIDLPTKRVTQTLAVDVRGANRLKFTPDGVLVFVSTLRGSDVTVIRADTRTVAARIPVGHGAAGIQMQPNGARVFVACTAGDDVAILDPKALAVVGRIAAGKEPDGLAWASRP